VDIIEKGLSVPTDQIPEPTSRAHVEPSALNEVYDVGPEEFRQIVSAQQPVVLRGVARDWPLVAKWRESPGALVDYLLSLHDGSDVLTVTAEPEVRGRLGYQPGSTKLNHVHSLEPLAEVLRKIVASSAVAEPPAFWIGGLAAEHRMPGLRAENDITLTPAEAEPHLTICNAVTIPAHIDSADNIAIVVAGRRRFTVFPPDQVANLYIGPLHPTPAGVPISLVNQDAPDFDQYPRFRDALRAGFVADLGPGDAIYIPYLWWHGVQSLDEFNMLVNFWWYSHKTGEELPWITLLKSCHRMFRGMPATQREAWRDLFDFWVFEKHGDPTEHLSSQQRPAPISNQTVGLFRDQVEELLVRDS
jgi:hypothetical protein